MALGPHSCASGGSRALALRGHGAERCPNSNKKCIKCVRATKRAREAETRARCSKVQNRKLNDSTAQFYLRPIKAKSERYGIDLGRARTAFWDVLITRVGLLHFRRGPKQVLYKRTRACCSDEWTSQNEDDCSKQTEHEDESAKG